MSVILLNSQSMHYEVLGRGRPIIFLHGWLGSWRYWIPTMQVTSGQFRSYGVDFWGFGDSAHNPERYSIDMQLDLVEQFLETMGIGKIALVGHGLGAIVGMQLAQKHPERVDRILAVGLPDAAHPVQPRFRASSPAELQEWLVGEGPDFDPIRKEVPKIDPLSIQTSLDEFDPEEMGKLVENMTTPRLLVYGVNDEVMPSTGLGPSADLPPNAHQIEFGASGHYPMLDARNEFNRLLMDFLALPAGESVQSVSIKEKWKRRVR